MTILVVMIIISVAEVFGDVTIIINLVFLFIIIIFLIAW